MAADAAALRVRVARLEGGARLIDCGIEAPGGLEAGRLLAEACMGGAGQVAFATFERDGLTLPGVTVRTDHPALACLASQYAGWAIKPEGYFAMGSGPLRAVARVEEALVRPARLRRARRRPGRPRARDARGPRPPRPSTGSRPGRASRPSASRSSPRRPPRRRPASRSPRASWRRRSTSCHELGFDVKTVAHGLRHRAAGPDREERPAGHRPNQRLHPLRRLRALDRRRRRRRSSRLSSRACPPRRPATTARRSTTCSSATAATSTRSTRCCSAPHASPSRT